MWQAPPRFAALSIPNVDLDTVRRERVLTSNNNTSNWSQRFRGHFGNWSPKPPECVLVNSVVDWDPLRIFDEDRKATFDIKTMDKLLTPSSSGRFSINPPWIEAPKPDYICEFDTWARLTDPSEGVFRLTQRSRTSNLSDLKRLFATFPVGNSAAHFIEHIRDALYNNDVVYVSMPAGYGKTLSARYIIESVFDRMVESIEGRTGNAHDRCAFDRTPIEMSKSLHLTPSATNATHAAHFLSSCLRNDPTVSAHVHPMVNYKHHVDPPAYGIEHMLLTYRDAEYAIKIGRYGFVVIDEAHIDDTAALSSFSMTLKGMAQISESAALSVKEEEDRRRIGKCLILSGIPSDSLADQFEQMTAAHPHLSFRALKLPVETAEWEEHRYPLDKNVLHALGDSNELRTLDDHYGRTPLTEEIAEILRNDHSITTNRQLKEEDMEVAHSRAAKLPHFVVPRIESALLAMQRKFVTNAYIEYHDKADKKKEIDKELLERRTKDATNTTRIDYLKGQLSELEQRPVKLPNILIYVPSTGAAQQVYKKIRHLDSNRFHPIAGEVRYVQPYRYIVCSRTLDVEESLTALERPGFAEWWGKGDEKSKLRNLPRFCLDVAKSSVIIVVNGAEAGLTIPNVGGIIESGLERLRTEASRTGLRSSYFSLSDYDLVEQRAGRGGRTQPTDHVLCLSTYGLRRLRVNGTSVMEQKRMDNKSIVDYIRYWHNANNYGMPVRNPDAWKETITEGRVTGALSETIEIDTFSPGTILNEMAMTPSRVAFEVGFILPHIDPMLFQQLLTYVGAGAALHGLIRVALLITKLTALAKPSSSNRAANYGPHASFNTIDIFADLIYSTSHRGANGRGRFLMEFYQGDTAALVEFHAQLLIAANWNIESKVPNKEELLAARPNRDNVWSGSMLPSGTIRPSVGCQQRLNRNMQREPDAFTFLYSRLVNDEERKQIWTVMRLLAFDLLHHRYITSVSELLTNDRNRFVFNLNSDPILSTNGRALITAIATMFSTRFAKTVEIEGDYQKNTNKNRGEFNEFFMWDQNGVVQTEKLRRMIRAELSWNVHDDHTWLRFDPTDVHINNPQCGTAMKKKANEKKENEKATDEKFSFAKQMEQPNVTSEPPPEPVKEIFVPITDPITDAQAAYFANMAGRWRVVNESNKEEQEQRTSRSILEVELNARCAFYGMQLQGDKERLTQIADFRLWLINNMPFAHTVEDPKKEYGKAVADMITIWNAAGPISPVQTPAVAGWAFYEATPSP